MRSSVGSRADPDMVAKRKAGSLAAGQEISHYLWNLKVHYHVYELTTGPYSEPHESSPHPHTLFLQDTF
jgi:hypothetical protein